jgi:hypothetical protein
MHRAFWFFSEVVIGVVAAGAISAIVTPLLMRAGRDPGPAALWVMLAVGTALSIAVGERLRKSRQRHRLS